MAQVLSRRGFIGVMASGASLALLSACGGTASVASTAPSSAAAAPPSSAPASAAAPASAGSAASAASVAASAAAKPSASGAQTASAAGAKPNAALPTYIPLTTRPKPDYASDGVLYEDGYDNYPKNPQKSWTKAAPGAGSNIAALSPGLYPPSNTLDKDQAWQAINKALNATVSFNIVPQQDYTTRLATVMAGGDLPDYMMMNPATVNGAAQFMQSQCADLTPYLAGDAIKDYPNLAAIPTFAWQNVGGIVNGKLYMVPIERYATGGMLFKNDTVYDKEFGAGYVPKNADDLKRMFQQVNKPQQNQWATSAYLSSATPTNIAQGAAYNVVFWSSVFGAPNNWGMDASGKLVKNVETPEFKETVGWLRDLVSAGLFHPNVLQYNLNSARADFIAGRFIIYPEGFGNPWNDFWRRGRALNPPVDFHPLKPFAAHDGGKAQHFLGPGHLGGNIIKKGSADRVKELLRIMDWLAAPFGSSEDLLLTSGIEGVDFKFDANGNPQTIGENLNLDANYVNWKYIVQHPQVMYVPDIPGYAKAEYDAEHAAIPFGVSDPTWGLYSPTQSTKGLPINQAFQDGLVDMIAGRRALTDFDQLVKDWQNNGGEQIRKEYMDAIQAAK